MAKVSGALASGPREAMGEEVALVNPLRRKGGAVLGPVRLSVKTGRYGASLSSLKFPEVQLPVAWVQDPPSALQCTMSPLSSRMLR